MKWYPWLFCILAGCATPPPKAPAPHLVTVAHPIVKSVPVYLEYAGHVTPYISVEVMGQVSGILTGQFFTEGQTVNQGDLLLVIDPRSYEANLAKAEAALAKTYASLQYAKDVTKRYASLVKENFISQLDYEEYVTNVVSDEAQIKQNQADIESAKITLDYCYIKAPMNCVTGKLNVKPGNYVDANSNTTLVTLNQIDPILVDFYVPETDLATIQSKQQEHPLTLEVFTESSHSHAYTGKLTLINNEVDTQTGSILLEGTFENSNGALWPGHFVDVRLILDEIPGALLVPTASVLIGATGHYVYVVKVDSTVEKKNVVIGQRHGESTVIYSGLALTDSLIVEGQLNISPGMKVTIQEKSS